MKQIASCFILGITPRSKQIGVSVFNGQELVFYAVKTFRKQNRANSLKCLREILIELLKKHQVQCVSLERIVYIQQHRSFVKTVYQELKTFSNEQNITLFEYEPKLIRQIICGLEKPTKHNTALLLSQRYSELARYFNVPRLWQKRYFAQLFDAIAVGLICAIECRETAQPAQFSSNPNETPNA